MIPSPGRSSNFTPVTAADRMFANALHENVPDDVTVNAIPPPPNPAPAAHFALFGTDCDHDACDTSHRSEEHTSELQSRPHLVCRLLLETNDPAVNSAASNTPFAVFVSA